MITRRALLASTLAAAPPPPPKLHNFRIWDEHCHLGAVPGETPEERIDVLIECADRLGIERLLVHQGYSSPLHPSPEELRLENDRVLRAIARHPKRTFGSVYLSPKYPELSLQEFDRCVRDGPMICIGEIEADRRCNVPEMDAIVERAAAMNVPVLQHTWLKVGGNARRRVQPLRPRRTRARATPTVQFVCVHTGGDWERGIRIIRSTKNVYAEIAGSNPTTGFVEMAVRELGAERVLYGSDVGGRSFASQLSKVLGARVPDAAKELILGGNLRRLLAPILRAKGR